MSLSDCLELITRLKTKYPDQYKVARKHTNEYKVGIKHTNEYCVSINVLDQMVIPRLQHGVESWDPTTDTIPMHTWVHPWLPVTGALSALLYVQ